MNPPLQFFQTPKGKAPNEQSLEQMSHQCNFLRPHEPQHSTMCCVALSPIDPSYMSCI